MALKTMFEFEQDFGGLFINGIVDTLCGGTGSENAFDELYARGLPEYMDMILTTRHGKKILDPWQLQLMGEDQIPLAEFTVKAYLKERERYIAQQLAYFDAEYNPIENYSQIESETIDFDRKKKTRDITNQEKAYNRTRTTQNPQVISEQYTEANIVNTTSQTASTVEQQTAPFESSSYFNQNKTTETPGTVTNTEQPYNRKFKTPQHTITETESLAAPKEVTQKVEDAAFVDQDRRELTRSGNIGVQTAAQMLEMDEKFHWHNRWMSKMVLEIVNLICEEVSFAL